MEIVRQIIFGIIQGVTELLPISSSGHLIIVGEFLNVQMSLGFLTFLHLTTGLAILIGFWKEIKDVWFSKKRNFILKTIFISMLPAGIIGFLFSDFIHNVLHTSLTLILFSLAFWGLVMIFVDYKFFNRKMEIAKIETISLKQALIIGIAQTIALIPGTSRSGITIMAGITMGLNRKLALAFSFLIGLPLILLSFLSEVFKNPENLNSILTKPNIIAGIISFLCALLSIYILKKISTKKFLTIFGIYRLILAFLLLLLLAT